MTAPDSIFKSVALVRGTIQRQLCPLEKSFAARFPPQPPPLPRLSPRRPLSLSSSLPLCFPCPPPPPPSLDRETPESPLFLTPPSRRFLPPPALTQPPPPSKKKKTQTQQKIDDEQKKEVLGDATLPAEFRTALARCLQNDLFYQVTAQRCKEPWIHGS